MPPRRKSQSSPAKKDELSLPQEQAAAEQDKRPSHNKNDDDAAVTTTTTTNADEVTATTEQQETTLAASTQEQDSQDLPSKVSELALVPEGSDEQHGGDGADSMEAQVAATVQESQDMQPETGTDTTNIAVDPTPLSSDVLPSAEDPVTVTPAETPKESTLNTHVTTIQSLDDEYTNSRFMAFPPGDLAKPQDTASYYAAEHEHQQQQQEGGEEEEEENGNHAVPKQQSTHRLPSLSPPPSPHLTPGELKRRENNFLEKLWNWLESEQSRGIMEFSPNGRYLMIIRPDAVPDAVEAAGIGKHKNYGSFQRQCCIYGWRRLAHNEVPKLLFSDDKEQNAIIARESEDMKVMQHETLTRDSPREEVRTVTRKAKPKPSRAKDADARAVANEKMAIEQAERDARQARQAQLVALKKAEERKRQQEMAGTKNKRQQQQQQQHQHQESTSTSPPRRPVARLAKSPSQPQSHSPIPLLPMPPQQSAPPPLRPISQSQSQPSGLPTSQSQSLPSSQNGSAQSLHQIRPLAQPTARPKPPPPPPVPSQQEIHDFTYDPALPPIPIAPAPPRTIPQHQQQALPPQQQQALPPQQQQPQQVSPPHQQPQQEQPSLQPLQLIQQQQQTASIPVPPLPAAAQQQQQQQQVQLDPSLVGVSSGMNNALAAASTMPKQPSSNVLSKRTTDKQPKSSKKRKLPTSSKDKDEDQENQSTGQQVSNSVTEEVPKSAKKKQKSTAPQTSSPDTPVPFDVDRALSALGMPTATYPALSAAHPGLTAQMEDQFTNLYGSVFDPTQFQAANAGAPSQGLPAAQLGLAAPATNYEALPKSLQEAFFVLDSTKGPDGLGSSASGGPSANYTSQLSSIDPNSFTSMIDPALTLGAYASTGVPPLPHNMQSTGYPAATGFNMYQTSHSISGTPGSMGSYPGIQGSNSAYGIGTYQPQFPQNQSSYGTGLPLFNYQSSPSSVFQGSNVMESNQQNVAPPYFASAFSGLADLQATNW